MAGRPNEIGQADVSDIDTQHDIDTPDDIETPDHTAHADGAGAADDTVLADDTALTADDALTTDDTAGLADLSAAMLQLQGLIDAFLDSPSHAASATTAPAPSPRAATSAAGTPERSGDGAGWDRAIATRSDTDPQRGWIEANAAMRRGEHARAFTLFEAAADRAAEKDDHARAAIAYRMASDAAAALGRRDKADHDLRRAGKQYLFLAENPANSLQTLYSSYLAASRCFLAVGNLELTQSCVTRALDLQQALNEDLHTRFNGPARQPG